MLSPSSHFLCTPPSTSFLLHAPCFSIGVCFYDSPIINFSPPLPTWFVSTQASGETSGLQETDGVAEILEAVTYTQAPVSTGYCAMSSWSAFRGLGKPVAHQGGRQWEPPVQATSSGSVCVCEWRELKNNNKTDEKSVCFLLFSCSNSSKQGAVIKYSSLIGADFSYVSSSHPWYNTGINKHQVGRL